MNFNISQEQESLNDAEFAVAVLNTIKSSIQEEDIMQTTIEVNAHALRNCMELMLSLLEVHEGMNVPAIEAMQEVMNCLKDHSTAHLSIHPNANIGSVVH